jgi:hypothetical protein
MCPIVSANWNNGANAGVWALNLNNVRSNSNNNVGGRADSNPYVPISTGRNGIKGDVFRQRVTGVAKSVCQRISGRAGLSSLERQAVSL